jgi:glycosyltransferase involved in cell wall biosynthesis
VGAGLDLPTNPPPRGFAAAHGLSRYLVYTGRLERGKNVDIAVDYATRFAEEQCADLKLVLIGEGSYTPPRRVRGRVVRVGFVDEKTKRSAYSEAVALVNPSVLESLSLVLLEAWAEGTPALVAAESEVMRGHCRRSGGGFWFGDYGEFAAGVSRLLADGHLRSAMGQAGKQYVATRYGWESVSHRVDRALVEILARE